MICQVLFVNLHTHKPNHPFKQKGNIYFGVICRYTSKSSFRFHNKKDGQVRQFVYFSSGVIFLGGGPEEGNSFGQIGKFFNNLDVFESRRCCE